ncbi:MAG: RIP metalloprotease RseP [Rhodocyclaceae bacterium]|nr:RIP metalloprotease RseP [Rhodocyclaceae bacterium]
MSVTTLLWYAASFFLALGVLVVVHEFGHYAVARTCGVKVLRFSIGFGKVIWSIKRGPDQTEWALAAFPLGGYVKMLDEREGPVAAEELHRSFTRATLGKRTLIVLAGPVANLLLAIFLYWLTFVGGTQELRPTLGEPPVGSIAAELRVGAGDTPLSVNGVRIQSWQDLRWEVLQHAMDKEAVEIEVMRPNQTHASYRVGGELLADKPVDQDVLLALGLVPFRPAIPPVVGVVQANSAAERAGMLVDDLVLAINGETIADWSELVAMVRGAPGRALQLEIRRNAQSLQIVVTPDSVIKGDKTSGRLGIQGKEDRNAFEARFVTVSYPPLEALSRAAMKTRDTSILTLRMMGRMLLGEISLKNISGPVTIADYAGQSASLGLAYYLGFLALISISLGVLNLLPIPVLDGGHLLYYFAEFVKGGPLSERAMEYGQQLGLVFLGILMSFAFYNDINRLISG